MNFLKKLMIIISGIVIVYSLFSVFKIISSTAPDFVVYYSAAEHIVHRVSPYSTTAFTLFAYPPISSLPYSLFVVFPYQFAQTVFVLLSFSCVFICVGICLKLLNKQVSSVAFFGIVALYLLSFPTKFTLGMGQSNLIALTCLLTAVLLERRHKSMSAGLLLALGIIFKPILLFCMLYFVLNNCWKAIISCVIAGSVLVVLQLSLFPCVLLFWQEYLTQVLPHLFTSVGREVYYNQGLLGTISRLTSNLQVRSILSLLGSLGILLGSLWIIWKYKPSDNAILALLLCALPLIDGLSWQHHFVVLLFPFFYMFYLLKSSQLGLILLAISYILVSINIRNPSYFTSFPQSLLLSHTFWGTCLLLALVFYTCIRFPKTLS